VLAPEELTLLAPKIYNLLTYSGLLHIVVNEVKFFKNIRTSHKDNEATYATVIAEISENNHRVFPGWIEASFELYLENKRLMNFKGLSQKRETNKDYLHVFTPKTLKNMIQFFGLECVEMEGIKAFPTFAVSSEADDVFHLYASAKKQSREQELNKAALEMR
jgi:hypothetical protein